MSTLRVIEYIWVLEYVQRDVQYNVIWEYAIVYVVYKAKCKQVIYIDNGNNTQRLTTAVEVDGERVMMKML